MLTNDVVSFEQPGPDCIGVNCEVRDSDMILAYGTHRPIMIIVYAKQF